MPRSRPSAALALVAGAALLAAGCVRSAQSAASGDGIEPVEQVVPAEPVVLYFVNSSTVGADVFATATPRDQRRLGTVQPGGTGRFVLPREVIRLGSTTVVARLHPSTRALQTGPLTVNSGDVFTVSLTTPATTLSVHAGRP